MNWDEQIERLTQYVENMDEADWTRFHARLEDNIPVTVEYLDNPLPLASRSYAFLAPAPVEIGDVLFDPIQQQRVKVLELGTDYTGPLRTLE